MSSYRGGWAHTPEHTIWLGRDTAHLNGEAGDGVLGEFGHHTFCVDETGDAVQGS